jgi:hypothetical protein
MGFNKNKLIIQQRCYFGEKKEPRHNKFSSEFTSKVSQGVDYSLQIATATLHSPNSYHNI